MTGGRAIRFALLAGVAAATLAACNRGGMLGGQPSPPPRKAGLWEETLQGDMQTGPPMVSKSCFDAASDLRQPVLGRRLQSGRCQDVTVTRGPNGSYVADAVCLTGIGAKVTSHTVVTGDFSNRYQIVVERTVENAPVQDLNGKHTTTITAVYKGACPPEIGPGMRQLPTGDIVAIGEGRRFRNGGGERPSTQ